MYWKYLSIVHVLIEEDVEEEEALSKSLVFKLVELKLTEKAGMEY